MQKSTRTKIAGMTSYKYRHPSYICYQSVSDFMKDVGMSTCKSIQLVTYTSSGIMQDKKLLHREKK